MWPWSVDEHSDCFVGSDVDWQETIVSSCGQGCAVGHQKGEDLGMTSLSSEVECCQAIPHNLVDISSILQAQLEEPHHFETTLTQAEKTFGESQIAR